MRKRKRKRKREKEGQHSNLNNIHFHDCFSNTREFQRPLERERERERGREREKCLSDKRRRNEAGAAFVVEMERSRISVFISNACVPVWACDLRRARFLRRFLASLFVVEIRVLCVENMPASTLLTQNLHVEPYILIVVVHVCCLALCAPMINSRPTCRFLNQGRGWAVREF